MLNMWNGGPDWEAYISELNDIGRKSVSALFTTVIHQQVKVMHKVVHLHWLKLQNMYFSFCWHTFRLTSSHYKKVFVLLARSIGNLQSELTGKDLSVAKLEAAVSELFDGCMSMTLSPADTCQYHSNNADTNYYQKWYEYYHSISPLSVRWTM